MRNAVAVSCVGVLLLFAAPASAQDKGQIGLAMRFPANIGVLWHVIERIAIRPGISIGRTSIETTSTTTLGVPPETFTSSNSFSSTTVGIELDVMISVKKWDEVRAYVAP